MENNHKTFKPFEKVLVKDVMGVWYCAFYSHWSDEYKTHNFTSLVTAWDKDILPYEGNEHLVGTTDEPEEEIKLEEGEWVMYAFGGLVSIYPLDYMLGEFIKINEGDNTITIQDSNAVRGSSKFIKFSYFNPSDMEETKKHILCVKNGRIVKYKG